MAHEIQETATRWLVVAAAFASATAAIAQTPPPAAPAAAPAPTPFTTPTLQRIRATGTITLAHRESSIPFSYFDADKRPIGYAMDLCLRVVDAIKRELKLPNLAVQFMAISAAQRLPTIIEGKADLECGNTTNTAARRQQVAFTMTHYFAGGRLLVRTGSPIRGFTDLRGKQVVATKGSTHAAYVNNAVERGLTDARLIEVKDSDEAFAMVEQGKVDAFLMDDIVLASLRANSPNAARVEIVGNLTTVEPLAIMLRKNDPEFKRVVDLAVSRVMVDGDIRAIYDRWFLQPIPPNRVALNVPMNALMRDQIKFPSDRVGDRADE